LTQIKKKGAWRRKYTNKILVSKPESQRRFAADGERKQLDFLILRYELAHYRVS
jgi:hypothetical protein